MFPLGRSSTDTILPGVLIEQREEDEPGEEGLQQVCCTCNLCLLSKENVPEEGREFEETLTIPISARTHHERIPAACLSHPCSPPLNQSLSVRPSQPLRQTAVVNKPTLTPNNTSQRCGTKMWSFNLCSGHPANLVTHKQPPTR